LKDPEKSKWYIAAAVACFASPAAVALLVLTIIEFHRNIKKKNDAILYSSIALMIFAVGYFIMFAATDSLDWTLLSGMVVPQAVMSVYLFIAYVAHARYARRNARCLSLIKNDHFTSLFELGSVLVLNEKQIRRCILRLIDAGELDGASIDEASRTIRFAKSVWARQRFVCKNCGAALTVDFGHTLVCEYCGQALPVNKNQASSAKS
jgi:Ca2+/Na+ antiporter